MNSGDNSSQKDEPKDTVRGEKGDFAKPLIIAIIILVCSISAGAAAIVMYIKFFKNKN